MKLAWRYWRRRRKHQTYRQSLQQTVENGGASGAAGFGLWGCRWSWPSYSNEPDERSEESFLVTPVSHAGEPSQAGSSGGGDGTHKGGGGGEGATGGLPIEFIQPEILLWRPRAASLTTGGHGGNGG